MNKQYSRFALNCLAVAALSAALIACNKKPDEVVIPVVEDSVLTANVRAALSADPELRGMDLQAVAKSGVVELSGGFDNYAALDRAVTVIRGVTGVKNVDDKTVKKEGAAPAAPAVEAAPAVPAAEAPAAPAAPK